MPSSVYGVAETCLFFKFKSLVTKDCYKIAAFTSFWNVAFTTIPLATLAQLYFFFVPVPSAPVMSCWDILSRSVVILRIRFDIQFLLICSCLGFFVEETLKRVSLLFCQETYYSGCCHANSLNLSRYSLRY